MICSIKGEGGFREGDLYVFCVTTSDGKFVATGNPNSKQLLGVDVKTIKDSNGNPIKLDGATQKPEGEITTIDYNFANPGTIDKPVPKETYITRVNDLTCGVGYYYFDKIENPVILASKEDDFCSLLSILILLHLGSFGLSSYIYCVDS